MEPWLEWVRRLQAIADTGLAYASNPYDLARYEEVRVLAGEVAGQGRGLDPHGAGHPTPKVDVRGAVFAAARVLLVREVADGGWTLPGGWADIGEPPSRAVAREVREEAGVAVRPVKLVAVHDRDLRNHPAHIHHIYKLIFECERVDDRRDATDGEVDAVGWFALADLPQLSTGRTSVHQLERAFAHRAEPGLPTEFD
ncbi:MAG TPA: NUDIX hydrolase N-terminal domain-containing protein [Solirubrobacteraceae bacterium]|nr:NUDIX hydrolase N-terminal domain-containing protein [Solirubrobacteraceae bacterium]